MPPTPPPSNDVTFEVGDHVYHWCSIAGIPGVFQHHGIVVGVQRVGNETNLTIVDFTVVLPNTNNAGSTFGCTSSSSDSKTMSFSSKSSTCGSNGRSCSRMDDNDKHQRVNENIRDPLAQLGFTLSSTFPDAVRNYTSSSRKWHKVVYKASSWQQSLWRSGTCTMASSDPPDLVMARVSFLMKHKHLIPPYHFLQSNCECMAMWCKTGQWSTLQGISLLKLPVIGVVTATEREWKRTTERLNREFRKFAAKEQKVPAKCSTTAIVVKRMF